MWDNYAGVGRTNVDAFTRAVNRDATRQSSHLLLLFLVGQSLVKPHKIGRFGVLAFSAPPRDFSSRPDTKFYLDINTISCSRQHIPLRRTIRKRPSSSALAYGHLALSHNPYTVNNTTAATTTMRRESTSSDAASVVSYETTSSLVKEDVVVAVLDAAADKKRKGLRAKARRVLSDMGAPPTARQDAKDGRRTLNYADPGGLVGDVLAKPLRI
ncbi:hypothetical protein NLG97_g2700 [Lecanicillium saksenae]|uniref:Uncharacterized protein n=1 Tax=Lecanicillium saksenae TaxID=468837 RepID=A0ACC1R0U6_9HYPO|nr:hypothetical protein NLG97_g2700 [Lecanicillium saksenae]